MAEPSFKDLAYRALANTIGGPVDVATMFMRPFGYDQPEENIFGSSEYIGKKLEQGGVVSEARDPTQEFLSSLLVPSPTVQLKTAGMLPELLMGMLGATAFHGTPHKIVDKFDINKVGTGEGAQVYGHGMYFAENPKVAQDYQTMMAKVDPDLLKYKNKEIIDLYNSAEKAQQKAYRMPTGAEKNSAIEKANAELSVWEDIMLGNHPEVMKMKVLNGTDVDAWEAKDNFINSLDLGNFKGITGNVGNLYKVDIPDADIPKMFDWDKPFNQQTPEVQSAFTKLYSDVKIAGPDNADWFKNIDKDHASMSAMYRNLATSDNLKGAKDVSRLLSQEGVTGVRYLDQGSRTTGQGTSNFVTFNPEQVKILEENGINYEELIRNGLLGK